VVNDGGGRIHFTGTDFIYAEGGRLTVGSDITGIDPAHVATTGVTGTYSINGEGLLDALTLAHDAGSHDPAPVETIAEALPSPDAPPTAGHSYVYDIPAVTGHDSIAFATNDLFITNRALYDGNKDGIITFGANGVLDIDRTKRSAGTDTVEIIGATGLRSLGSKDGQFFYADDAVRPTGAIEGTVGNDALKGTANTDTFFFDNALGVGLGHDTINGFSASDRIVTTGALTDSNHDGVIAVGADGAFQLPHAGDGISEVSLFDAAGSAIAALNFDGTSTIDGVTYYIYSQAGGSADLLTH
jgi:hypothetical protein